jgi:kynurenine formamidase
MRNTLLVMALVLTACSESEPVEMVDMLSSGTLIDMTYDFDEQTIYWPTAGEFVFQFGFAGETPAGFYYEAHGYSGSEHGGTHLDAPVHFSEGMQTVDQIPIERLVGQAVVVDVTSSAADDRDYQISVQDVENWELANGQIPDDSIVLFRTGFGQYWPDRQTYLGTAERGPEAVADLHFPGIDPDLARWLVQNRKIGAVGIDTASIDRGQSTLFETHQILFAENIPAFENVASLDRLPITGSVVFALPMKIGKGSGAPLRMVGWIESAP